MEEEGEDSRDVQKFDKVVTMSMWGILSSKLDPQSILNFTNLLLEALTFACSSRSFCVVNFYVFSHPAGSQQETVPGVPECFHIMIETFLFVWCHMAK